MSQLVFSENIPLAPFTTMSVGGPARYFMEAATENDIREAIEFTKKNSMPIFFFSGGSNIVVSDSGFDGLFVRIAVKGREFVQLSGEIVEVRAGAGENWDSFVADVVKEELWGIECLSGIPGSVGGTPIQNVGAYGQEVSETITEVVCLELASGEIKCIPNSECGFSYRKSRFNSTDSGKFVVLHVRFRLRKNGTPNLRYPEIATSLSDKNPNILEIRNTILDIRRSKAMVFDPTDPNSRSAGSFFKNPIVSVDESQRLQDLIPGLPVFPAEDGFVKVPAAKLIEAAGFKRGYRLGNAGISERHSLAITNRGGATAKEIVSLARLIRGEVAERFNILLTPEPVFVGIEL